MPEAQRWTDRMREKLAIFLDLDDTLVDTYGLLITPLERTAVEILCRIEGRPFQEDQLLNLLLDLRKKNPGRLQEELARVFPEHADSIIAVRRDLFRDFEISDLKIGSEVVDMLRDLSHIHDLVLLTEGSAKIQNAKIDHLGIRTLFSKILIVENLRGETKEKSVSDYLKHQGISPRSAVIVGNRVDREIAAGRKLGTKTVWVRSGEGSEYDGELPTLDAIIESITELPSALESLAGLSSDTSRPS